MLTTCQVKTLEAFKKFLRGDPGVFTISGEAGTGKSTLITEMVEAVQQHNNLMLSLDLATINEVHKAAPTNFAAAIIGGQTIHKAFSIKFNKFKNDELKPFIFMEHNNLYIVDEASMVSKEIYNLIISRAKEEKSYVVFMGDINQLFPVKETLSNTFKNHELHEMKTVVRQDNKSKLYQSIQQAKAAIYDDSITLEANEDVQIVSSEEEFKKLLKEQFNDKPSNARVLVYSNNRANEYRKFTGRESYLYYQDKPIGRHLAGADKDYTALPVTTIHKAQGRTYSKVFIDYRDIIKSKEHRRLFYVALSRASHKAVILI
jgi:ATP-dependent exoDNAse (exonuclease V) alpha subunit